MRRIKKPDAMLGGEQRRRATDRSSQKFTATIDVQQQANCYSIQICEISMLRYLLSDCLTKATLHSESLLLDIDPLGWIQFRK